jgi:hypothetical protein
VDDEVYGGRNTGTSRKTAIQSSAKCGRRIARLFARGSAAHANSITHLSVVVFLPTHILTNNSHPHSGLQMQGIARDVFLKQLFIFGARLLQPLYRIRVR